MSEQWVPFGVRMGVQEPVRLKNEFSEDPVTLKAVSDWLGNGIGSLYSPDFEPLIGACNIPVYKDQYNRPLAASRRVFEYAFSDEIPLLNTVEYLAAKSRNRGVPAALNSLCLHYNVNWRFDTATQRLVRRVLPETQEHYENLAKSVDQACSEYLHQAFANAYGHNGDPGEAWAASRKAVEFLLHPIVSPNNTRATISSMIRDIRQAPHKWVSAIPANSSEESVLKFVELLKMMPYEPGHHGQTPGNPTAEQARTQFNLALTVCQIIKDDGFRMADS
ncbi:hypothetical protein [Rothia sp. P5766]|uniref:hypothetical protein n=1 Tax=Rothia sp. P5766 TaxID=3402656 RepID=UPI003AE163D7